MSPPRFISASTALTFPRKINFVSVYSFSIDWFLRSVYIVDRFLYRIPINLYTEHEKTRELPPKNDKVYGNTEDVSSKVGGIFLVLVSLFKIIITISHSNHLFVFVFWCSRGHSMFAKFAKTFLLFCQYVYWLLIFFIIVSVSNVNCILSIIIR